MKYSKKDTTPQQIIKMFDETLENAKFKTGDVVKLKGDVNSPKMAIGKKNANITIPYASNGYGNSDIHELTVLYECTWFNKSIQNFVTRTFIEEVLEIVE